MMTSNQLVHQFSLESVLKRFAGLRKWSPNIQIIYYRMVSSSFSQTERLAVAAGVLRVGTFHTSSVFVLGERKLGYFCQTTTITNGMYQGGVLAEEPFPLLYLLFVNHVLCRRVVVTGHMTTGWMLASWFLRRLVLGRVSVCGRNDTLNKVFYNVCRWANFLYLSLLIVV